MASLAIGGYEQARKDKSKAKEDLYSQVELFADAISVIRTDYVDETDPKKLIYGALKGMLGSLDDFSEFMEPEEYNQIKIEAKGEFGGVGIEISMREGVITIIAPITGTPAEAAGIKPGDKIIRINGKTTKDMTLEEAIKTMRGEPGTPLTLTIWREKDQKVIDVPMKRAMIKIESIKKAHLVEDKIGYIKLVEFQERTPRDLEEALVKLEKEGMDSFILDLRNNPGGLLETAVTVAEKFLPKDSIIVSIKGRVPEQNVVFKSSGKFPHPDYPIVVLVNEGSASASEIVAGAIQDHRRGVILGMKTFGKGSVQTVLPLKDGSALRLTTALYFTPSGRIIRNQGVIPDVVVEREELKAKNKDKAQAAEIFEKTEENPERDNQLERAIDLMKALKVYRAKQ